MSGPSALRAGQEAGGAGIITGYGAMLDPRVLERVVRRVQVVRRVHGPETDVVLSTALEGRPLPVARAVAITARAPESRARADAGQPIPSAPAPPRRRPAAAGDVPPRTGADPGA